MNTPIFDAMLEGLPPNSHVAGIYGRRQGPRPPAAMDRLATVEVPLPEFVRGSWAPTPRDWPVADDD